MTDTREKLVFGRYSREDCGLPPIVPAKTARWKKRLNLLLIVCAVVVAGWIAGTLRARWRSMRLEALPDRLAGVPTQAEKDSLLAEGKILATALAGDPEARLYLAEACMVASIGAPRQFGFYGNAAALLAGLGDRLADSPVRRFRAESMHAHVLAELERHREALDAVNRANLALEQMEEGRLKRVLTLNMVNLQAYLLATAADPLVKNPEKALHLAQIMITSRDELPDGEYASGVAAFVDTLATAWFAAGNADKALKTQTVALGLAKPGDISVYLRHYDEFVAAAKAQPPKLMAFYN